MCDGETLRLFAACRTLVGSHAENLKSCRSQKALLDVRSRNFSTAKVGSRNTVLCMHVYRE